MPSANSFNLDESKILFGKELRRVNAGYHRFLLLPYFYPILSPSVSSNAWNCRKGLEKKPNVFVKHYAPAKGLFLRKPDSFRC